MMRIKMINTADIDKNKWFLVVDDYESMRMLISDHLSQLGFRNVILADSGDEALKTIIGNLNTEKQIDFLITDLIMENGTGLDLIKNLRALDNLKKLPILLITSKSEVSLIIECVKAGATQFIVKPWSIEDLEKKICECLNKSNI
jgi:two-component system chemotaxis response regulator CheY